MRIRRSKEEWENLIKKQKESGKPITVFCKEKGIHPNLFYRKLKNTKKTGGFVKIQAPVMKKNAITIKCENISVSVPLSCTKDEFILLLRSIKEAGYA